MPKDSMQRLRVDYATYVGYSRKRGVDVLTFEQYVVYLASIDRGSIRPGDGRKRLYGGLRR